MYVWIYVPRDNYLVLICVFHQEHGGYFVSQEQDGRGPIKATQRSRREFLRDGIADRELFPPSEGVGNADQGPAKPTGTDCSYNSILYWYYSLFIREINVMYNY